MMSLGAHQKNHSVVLAMRDISYRVGGRVLLDQVSVTVSAGDILAVIGPNGAGKTTLLNTLSGMCVPHRGKVLLGGRALYLWPQNERARALAVLPQFSVLSFPFTVDEVVALGRIPHSTGKEIDKAIVAEAMAAMDITYLTGRNYMALSGGEKQRTQLARVMAQIWRQEDANQRVLLLDEPTMALDLGHQQQLMDAISDFAKQGIAVVMVMHDLNLAAQYAEHLLALRCGQVVAYGAVNDVLTDTLVRDLFQARVSLINHPDKNVKVLI